MKLKKINKTISVNGWVDSIRNFGKIVFLSLRNRDTIIQIVIKKKKINLKKNYCINVKGRIVKHNNKIEIICKKINILNKSVSYNNTKISEKEKSKNRIFYLKKMSTKNFFLNKSLMYLYIRKYLIKNNFIEIETPILTKKTKEGAKLFKIKKNIYLSQSPQLFKQILMISEYERYFQFAKCFRNENTRNDRQHEFTQLDIEASFLKKCDIFKISYSIIKLILKLYKIEKFKIFFIKYKECIVKYGTDKPDLRNKIHWKKINKKIFYLNIRKKIKKKIKINKKKVSIFLLKSKYLYLVFKKKIYPKVLEYIIKKICYSKEGKINKIYKKIINIIFVNDIPMFKKKKKCFHHPFTYFKEIKKSVKYIKKNFKKIKSESYDIIINGTEVAGGSIRIYNFNEQIKLLKILNIEKHFEKFIFFLKCGTPPHLGIAFGIDRILQKILYLKSIRDCIAFPRIF
ncbi:OB-fold nucleic acid binding domain-containing protein [Candidatus Vidania fulgoroideae]|uniref:OB-fold nucleic acid binding domain-containing protein n=1 Tax=Candidatus Vidania fulgoroideorum TaxID=881286 RepID=A0AAX3N8Q4_9PROT|nr:OB-fold nucleic acid binding domain-containing protein [Candidatus Vidania fulgoroideae]